MPTELTTLTAAQARLDAAIAAMDTVKINLRRMGTLPVAAADTALDDIDDLVTIVWSKLLRAAAAIDEVAGRGPGVHGMSDAPNAYQIERALAAWHEAREKLLTADVERDEAALAEILGASEAGVDDMIARALRAKVHAEAMVKAADEQAALMIARKRRYQMREDTMKQLAVDLMTIREKRKVELGDLTASVIAGRIGVYIPDPDKVPDLYCEIVVTKKPDKEVIRSQLEAGQPVQGAELKVGSDYLMIRRS